MLKLIVQGELDVLTDGMPGTVIIQLVCKSQMEAEEVLHDRIGRYKNLKILEIETDTWDKKKNKQK